MFGIATAVLLVFGMVTGVGAQDGNEDNVTLCHATGSETNPYEVITIDPAGAFNGHLGEDHQNGEDIIPPFEYQGQTYSQNYDEEGQAILENECQVPDDEEPNGEVPVGELPEVGVGPNAGADAGAHALLIGLATVVAAGGFVARRGTMRL